MAEKRNNRFIIGTAISIAAIATAIDHTRHRLPEPVQTQNTVSPANRNTNIPEKTVTQPPGEASPCSLDTPCGLGVSPCSMD